MKDLIAKLHSDAADQILATFSTLEMQLQGFAKSSYEKDLRIAELEAQIAAASAPVVEQQTSCAYCNKGTCYKHDDAPQAADTDKLREAILEIHVILPSGYDEREVSAFKAGAKATSDAALKVLASTALQAPVGDGIANDTEAVQAILDGNRLQAPVREVPEWIRVKDQLPGIGVDVVVYCGYMVTAQRTNDQHDPENHKGWVIDFDNGRATEITHWLPLPAAPVQQEGE